MDTLKWEARCFEILSQRPLSYTSAEGTNAKHAISLKAWLQCHLHSNAAVCHLGTFTLRGFMTTSIPMVSQHIKQRNMSSASSSASLPSAHKCGCSGLQALFINTRAICLPGRSSARLGSVRCQVTVFERGIGRYFPKVSPEDKAAFWQKQ